MAPGNWYREEGAPQPLGATYLAEERAYNFALYSRHATGVTLLLFGADDLVTPQQRVPLTHLRNKSGRVWHCRLDEATVGAARFYGYAVAGPYDPSQGLLFDPEKTLLDPYARGLGFPATFDRGAASRAGAN